MSRAGKPKARASRNVCPRPHAATTTPAKPAVLDGLQLDADPPACTPPNGKSDERLETRHGLLIRIAGAVSAVKATVVTGDCPMGRPAVEVFPRNREARP